MQKKAGTGLESEVRAVWHFRLARLS